MNVHENARLVPHGRADLVDRALRQGRWRKALAAAFEVDRSTVQTALAEDNLLRLHI